MRRIVPLGISLLIFICASARARGADPAETARKQLEQAVGLIQQQRLDDAARILESFDPRDVKDADFWIDLGDTWNLFTPHDPRYLPYAREAWEIAQKLDPKNAIALNRLLSFWTELAEMDDKNDYLSPVRALCDRTLAADPDNITAVVALHVAIVREALKGGEPEKNLSDSVAKLKELAKRDPGNAETHIWLAKGTLHLARKLALGGNVDRAAELSRQANQDLEAAVAAQPKNAALLFGAARVMEDQYFATLKAKLEDRAADFQRRKNKLLHQAGQAVTPDDPLCINVLIALAQSYAQNSQPDKAEQVLRSLINVRPESRQARLALAEHIASKGKRSEAIELLEHPNSDKEFIGPRVLVKSALEVRTCHARASMRIDQLQDANTTERPQIVALIQRDIQQLIALEGEGVRALLLKAKLQRSDGQTLKALEILQRADALAQKRKEGPTENLEKWEIVDLLARSYIETRQDEKALEMLKQLTERFPDYLPGRILVAQIYIRRDQLEQARPHVVFVRNAEPENPDGIKLQLQLAQDAAEIKSLLAKLPEKTKAQAMDKVNSAMTVKEYAEAWRLLETLQQRYPSDSEVKNLALKVARGLPAGAQNAPLAPRQQPSAPATSPDNIEQRLVAARELIRADPDDTEGWISMAEALAAANRPDAAMSMYRAAFQRVDKALAKKPDDPASLLKAGQAYLAAAQLSRSHDYLTKAGELFEQGVKKWPDEPTFYAYAAEVALKQTNNAHAEEVLLALPARKSWANRFEPYLLLAEFYEKTGKPQRQIVMIQEALRVAPSEPKVLQRRDAIPGFPAAPASAPAAR